MKKQIIYKHNILNTLANHVKSMKIVGILLTVVVMESAFQGQHAKMGRNHFKIIVIIHLNV